jgi:short-subunit dehydrogenase
MAFQFAAKGRALWLCARRLDRLEQLQAQIKERYPKASVHIAELDVRDAHAVRQVFHAAWTQGNGLDRIIVNAGIGGGYAVGKDHLDDNLMILNTNLNAALAQCEVAVQLFKSQGHGHLVTIASMAAIRGLPGATVYAASKAGLLSLTEGIRANLWRTDIKVSAICPGFIDTEILSSAKKRPFLVSCEVGTRSIVRAIEWEQATAHVPMWPWALVRPLLAILPLSFIVRWI